jgi:CCR4-NOT transcription complex subunit 9
MGFGNQGSYYNAQQILSQQGGGGAANAMHHQHDRIGSAQGHRAGGMSGGAPHLLPNQLAASLNNPGMPGATSPNPAPEMLLSQFQSKGANMTHNVFSPQSHPSLPQGGHPSHHQGQQGAQQQAQQAGQTGRLLLLPSGQAPPPNSDEAKIYVLIAELLDPQTRETALLELSKKREMYEDLALVLWGGFGRCRFTFTQAMLASFD